MASDDWPDERARATAVVGAQGRDEPGGGRSYDRQIQDRSDPGSWGREQGPARRGLLMPLAASLAVLAGFAGAVWYAYNWGLEDGSHMEIPLVEAEDAPLKVRPDDPGGLKVPNQDSLVMNRDSADEGPIQVERLLPEPETPQPLEPLERPAEADAAATAEVPATPPEVAAAAQEPATGPAAADETRLTEAPLPSSGQPTVDQSQPGRATSAAEGGDGAARPAAGTTRTARLKAATQVSELKQGDTVIQLASVASGEAAAQEWKRLQKAYPDLLGDMELAVQKVTVKGKEYHRMQTGPFPTRATAQEMCALLKAKKQACLVTKR